MVFHRKRWPQGPPHLAFLGSPHGLTESQTASVAILLRWMKAHMVFTPNPHATPSKTENEFRYGHTHSCRMAMEMAKEAGVPVKPDNKKFPRRNNLEEMAKCGVVAVAPSAAPALGELTSSLMRLACYKRATKVKDSTVRVCRAPHIGILLPPEGGLRWAILWRPRAKEPKKLYYPTYPLPMPKLDWQEWPPTPEAMAYTWKPRWKKPKAVKPKAQIDPAEDLPDGETA